GAERVPPPLVPAAEAGAEPVADVAFRFLVSVGDFAEGGREVLDGDAEAAQPEDAQPERGLGGGGAHGPTGHGMGAGEPVPDLLEKLELAAQALGEAAQPVGIRVQLPRVDDDGGAQFRGDV